jgi:hypothetical protein
MFDKGSGRNEQSLTWPPQAILVSDWSISKKIFSSETAWPNEPKLGRKHPWKILNGRAVSEEKLCFRN